jgi:hypothetical protein
MIFVHMNGAAFSSIVLSITSLSPLDPFFDLFRIGMDGSDVTVLIYV